LGNGDGSFRAAVSYVAGNGVALVPMDNDELLDGAERFDERSDAIASRTLPRQ
jgi:hypothetical protein